MAKLVKVAAIPWCDICTMTLQLGGRGVRAKYNTPLNKRGQDLVHHSWASLCSQCFELYGIDASITEEYIRA